MSRCLFWFRLMSFCPDPDHGPAHVNNQTLRSKALANYWVVEPGDHHKYQLLVLNQVDNLEKFCQSALLSTRQPRCRCRRPTCQPSSDRHLVTKCNLGHCFSKLGLQPTFGLSNMYLSKVQAIHGHSPQFLGPPKFQIGLRNYLR